MKISLQNFTPWLVQPQGDDRYLFPRGMSALHFDFPRGTFCGEIVTPSQYLSLDVTVLGDRAAGICFEFTEEDAPGPGMTVKMGVLPGLKTRLAIPFSALSGGDVFLPRTPGKLKTVVGGHPMHLDRLVRFGICVDKTPHDLTLKLENLCILDEEPDYPLEHRIMVDELGQKKVSDWKNKTHGKEALIAALRAEAADTTETPLPDRSVWGGWTKKKLKAGTGYFSLHHDGRRWWLCDPDGYAFFSTGFDCVGLGDQCNLTGITGLCENLPPKTEIGWSKGKWMGKETENFNYFVHNAYRAFGEDYYGIWADMIRRRLISWGSNTIACWSDMNFIRREKMPYVIIGWGYPQTKTAVFRDFPDVFSPEFEENAEQWAHFLDETKGDAYLLGYFLSNEPAWAFVNNINLAAAALAGAEHTHCKDYIVGRLKEQYGEISALNAAWNASFDSFDALYTPFEAEDLHNTRAMEDLRLCALEMIRRYIRIPSEAARRVDPNHLNLGIRYAWLSSPDLAAGCEYTDIFSFNCYSMDPTSMIEDFSRLTGKPVIIGEFHFGALDRGMDATGLRGVESQTERGIAYRYYMHHAAAHPACLGAHYFILYDQAYLGRFDGENYQIGALDVCSRPYPEFIDGVRRANGELYAVADGTLAPTDEAAKEIPAISY